VPDKREECVQMGDTLNLEIVGDGVPIRGRKSRGKVKQELAYLLENMEKKFVYNLMFDQYGMKKTEVDGYIGKYGLQNVRLTND